MIYAKTGMAEMPEKCRTCPYVFSSGGPHCSAVSNWKALGTIHSKPNWCPLVEIDENTEDEHASE